MSGAFGTRTDQTRRHRPTARSRQRRVPAAQAVECQGNKQTGTIGKIARSAHYPFG
jgi:hypothetical protein